MRTKTLFHPIQLPLIALLMLCVDVHAIEKRVSQPIRSVLREPLPAEDLKYVVSSAGIVIEGPTFRYSVDKQSGVIRGLEVTRGEQVVISLREPVDLILDDYRLSSGGNTGKTVPEFRSKNKIILKTTGVLKNKPQSGIDIPYTLQSTFFNDGVVVSRMTLKPTTDLSVKKIICSRLSATGHFRRYLHKHRKENGASARNGLLPESGKTLNLKTLASCLEVFSPEAALAIFTDSGAVHLSESGMNTAFLNVREKSEQTADVSLQQNIISISEGAKPYLVKAGEVLTFRIGISVAPNRRSSDLRMFVWIGDQKYPYPRRRVLMTVLIVLFPMIGCNSESGSSKQSAESNINPDLQQSSGDPSQDSSKATDLNLDTKPTPAQKTDADGDNPIMTVNVSDVATSATGTIIGTVIYQADPQRKWRYSRYYVKDRKKGSLAEAVVGLRSTKLKKLATPSEPKQTTIDQKEPRFTPETVAIRSGDSMKFTNGDPFIHNVHTSNPLCRFDESIKTGQSFTQSL